MKHVYSMFMFKHIVQRNDGEIIQILKWLIQKTFSAQDEKCTGMDSWKKAYYAFDVCAAEPLPAS